MTLSELPSGASAVVKEIHGGFELRRQLHGVGVLPGGTVEVLRSGALGGPVLVAIRGARVAIGRSQAQKVEVDLLESG